MRVWTKEDINNFISNNLKINKRDKITASSLYEELQKAYQYLKDQQRIHVGGHFIYRVSQRFGFDLHLNDWIAFWETNNEDMVLCFTVTKDGYHSLGLKHNKTNSFFALSKNIENDSWSLRTAWPVDTTQLVLKKACLISKKAEPKDVKLFNVSEGIQFFQRKPDFEAKKVKGSKKISIYYKGQEVLKLFDLKNLQVILSYDSEEAFFTYLKILGVPDKQEEPNIEITALRTLLLFIGDVRVKEREGSNFNLFDIVQNQGYISTNIYTNLSKRLIKEKYISGDLLNFIIETMVKNKRYIYQNSCI